MKRLRPDRGFWKRLTRFGPPPPKPLTAPYMTAMALKTEFDRQVAAAAKRWPHLPPEMRVRFVRLSVLVRHPRFDSMPREVRGSAKDEVADLKRDLVWVWYQRFRSTADKKHWQDALDWVKADSEEVVASLLETLATAAPRREMVAHKKRDPEFPGCHLKDPTKPHRESDSEWIARLRRIRKAFGVPVESWFGKGGR